MSLEGIISVAGYPGLYKVLTQTKSGFIVESLLNNKRQPVSATQRISMLEDISIFTITDDIPLNDVFRKMKQYESGSNEIISTKSGNDKLKEFFGKVLPDFDEDRVYPSDIKKIISWYNLVKDLIHDEQDDVQETEEKDESNSAEPGPTETSTKSDTDTE